ncbi:serine/threonine-protein kinase [Prauserella muralis]|uniref:non-specific serine/threonine protein kinase n=1 Tax=Prauserella muralis TaxID=588067 RepID=A0A2V4B1G5_9PSEU|nr:serine/threonine-protein kinase [Prauserella muralis]PXY27996.1 serine/threonine protein kinase [Prauserella muralis]TWE22215.1 serine/threonine protein kinase [Prauserella muralis]
MSDAHVHRTQTTQAAPQPRVVAGRYRVLGELGRGGMGVVFRAEDTVIGRQVAIKELRLPDGAEDVGVFQERVLREVRTGGRLNDPAVVTVFDVVTEGDATFIVMELVEAPTLSEVVRSHGPLPPHQVAAIGEQVLAALEAAHQAGIVHRDVKPGNIMVAANGRVKLTDFGIAQAVDDPRLTTSGMLVGSPAFMAPERVAGQDALPASDLWSLGASLFFAVEGVLPFERATTAATLHAILHEVPYLTHTQGPLASAIMGLLIGSPGARLSAQQARGLLAMAAQQAPVPSTPPGGQPTAVHNGGQPPTLAAGHTMLGQPPAARGAGRRTALVVAGALACVALLAGGFFLGKPFWSPPADDARMPTLTYGPGGDITQMTFDSYDGCLNTPLAAGRSLVESNWLSCDEPHEAEWYASGAPAELESSTSDEAIRVSYPGLERLTAFGEALCGTAFRTNVVAEDRRAAVKYQTLVPTQAAWEDDSTDEPARYVRCFLVAADGGTMPAGSVRSLVK